MSFKIYNTLGHKIEDFIPYNKDKVTMYTCGPTVYHYAHIGNLRSYICEDVLEKALNYCGYNVKRVMNITDVGHLSSDADTGEDKMLKGAKREHKTVLEIAKYYTDCFKSDCDRLNIKWPETVVPATSLIDDYIKFIEVLMEKGYAYFTMVMCILTHLSLKNTINLQITMKKNLCMVLEKVLKKIQIREIKLISYFGLLNQNLIVKN